MTRKQVAAAWEPFINRSIAEYQRLPAAVRTEIITARRGAYRCPSEQAEEWRSRLPGYPYNRVVYAAIRGLEGREFPLAG